MGAGSQHKDGGGKSPVKYFMDVLGLPDSYVKLVKEPMDSFSCSTGARAKMCSSLDANAGSIETIGGTFLFLFLTQRKRKIKFLEIFISNYT